MQQAPERRSMLGERDNWRLPLGLALPQSIHIPEDEICFIVFDAPSSRHAALAAQRARLEPIRVVEAAPSPRQ